MLQTKLIEELEYKSSNSYFEFNNNIMTKTKELMIETIDSKTIEEFQQKAIYNNSNLQNYFKDELNKANNVLLNQNESNRNEINKIINNYTVNLNSNVEKAVITKTNEATGQIILNAFEQANEDIINITKSTGFFGTTSQNFFIKETNSAFLQILNGNKTITQVSEEIAKQLAERGATVVLYKNNWGVQEAVRNIMLKTYTTVANETSDYIAKELKTDGFETSAHAGARPSHQEWQGQQFTKEEFLSIRFELDDYGCRHTFYPIFIGITPSLLTDEELKKIKEVDDTVTEWQGKNYIAYEATQKQRYYERELRVELRKKKLGLNNNYKKLFNEYSTFSEKADLTVQRWRLYPTSKNVS